MVGSEVTISLNNQALIKASDDTYSQGSVGLRVVNTDATFRDVMIGEA